MYGFYGTRQLRVTPDQMGRGYISDGYSTSRNLLFYPRKRNVVTRQCRSPSCAIHVVWKFLNIISCFAACSRFIITIAEACTWDATLVSANQQVDCNFFTTRESKFILKVAHSAIFTLHYIWVCFFVSVHVSCTNTCATHMFLWSFGLLRGKCSPQEVSGIYFIL